MGDVIEVKFTSDEDDITHVMHDRQEMEKIYHCDVCGDLQNIGNVVWHTRPIEDHDVS